MSAWMPAPPPESLPAMVSTLLYSIDLCLSLFGGAKLGIFSGRRSGRVLQILCFPTIGFIYYLTIYNLLFGLYDLLFSLLRFTIWLFTIYYLFVSDAEG